MTIYKTESFPWKLKMKNLEIGLANLFKAQEKYYKSELNS